MTTTPRTNAAIIAADGRWTYELKEEMQAMERELNAAQNLIRLMEEALISIEEYWNRDNNEKAMEDACWHAVNTAADALKAKEAKP